MLSPVTTGNQRRRFISLNQARPRQQVHPRHVQEGQVHAVVHVTKEVEVRGQDPERRPDGPEESAAGPEPAEEAEPEQSHI